MSMIRSSWAALGAAVAITLGAGGISLTQAGISTGEKPVYVALDAPCRLVDTRPTSTVGVKNTPIGAGQAAAYEIQVTGANGNCTGALAIPADASGVALNVTAIAPVAPVTGRSYFTIYPADAPLPFTSNLNFLTGSPPVPNKVDVGLSAAGRIKIYNNEGTAHAAVDIFGYYIDHDHDDRYYTEGEIDTALGTKANAADVYSRSEADTRFTERRTLLTWVNDASVSFATGAFTFKSVRTIGSFTKVEGDTVVELDLNSHFIGTGGLFCEYQLRIDGVSAAGGTEPDRTSIIGGADNARQPLTGSIVFEGLTAGDHTISLWVRSDSGSCIENDGNHTRQLVVNEKH